jgi:hypothetical protein
MPSVSVPTTALSGNLRSTTMIASEPVSQPAMPSPEGARIAALQKYAIVHLQNPDRAHLSRG